MILLIFDSDFIILIGVCAFTLNNDNKTIIEKIDKLNLFMIFFLQTYPKLMPKI